MTQRPTTDGQSGPTRSPPPSPPPSTSPDEPSRSWRGPSERTWLDATWSARAALGSQGQVTAYRHRGVWLIEVDGDFADVSQDVDLAIQFALAEIPKGVVCSLMHPPGAAGAAGLVEALASAGRHVRRWPGTPIVVVCPDSATSAALARHPDGRLLTQSSSLLQAWAWISAHALEHTAQLHLGCDALTARTARQFLSRTCVMWDLSQHLASGPVIVSELVTNAVQHAGGEVDVFLAEYAGSLRIAVRDRDGASPVTPVLDLESLRGRGLRIVETLAQSSGALPAAGGGKLVWAVLGPDSQGIEERPAGRDS
jgi:anti-sigma regulatory factor (Ser/Thr protein kinase)